MPRSGLRVGVAFGGRSVEHDVSIVTAVQAMEQLAQRHTPVPLYMDRSGAWLTGPQLADIERFRAGAPEGEPVVLDFAGGGFVARGARKGLRGGREQPLELDAVVIAAHGTYGEDGSLAGALELAGLPYVGPPVGAAAVAMDKLLTKHVLRGLGIPVLDYVGLRRDRWLTDRDGCVDAALARFDAPVYVKPATLGSSVGVARCEDSAQVREALELAFELDRSAIVEPSAEGGMEVNCAVVGRPGAEPRASACEQPIATEGFLTFEDKYMRGGKGKGGASDGMKSADRVIPAPIGDELTATVQDLAKRTFTAIGCGGVARVDLLIDADGNPYVNEANTVPGSFSFYLFEPIGTSFPDLLDELLDLAFEEHREATAITRTFESNLLAGSAAGAKG